MNDYFSTSYASKLYLRFVMIIEKLHYCRPILGIVGL